MRKDKHVLVDLWIGIIVVNILAFLIGIWIVKEPKPYGLGLLLGGVTAVIFATHMQRTIQKVVENNDGKQAARMRISSLLRYLIAAVVLFVACISPYTNPIAVFIGIISLKVAAYLQPLTHKLSARFIQDLTD
ncbi:MAG: ATP synthase subunit I [Lachnospiraceae bacterium]|nr:ATP synthase subunit I [Lachnospiraceae bacterium]